ncbi:hypothetical protein J4E86_009377 [Alternaria arbusti]|uniref:uncharacterized protein n=1 Tax=Alternaria arbusti TaxID=232088 RepID=UPI002221197C|nr:uncharacterized protein J4E86_009377 [Alternaria arbusti]KAI4944319.1 hypothetical protein J4E86_009377 [Alternaria arbusti]
MPDLNTMFAKSQSTSKPHRRKKSVSFSPETNFEPGRATHQWKRSSATYSAGKYSCPPDVGAWLDTSLMSNELEQLLNFKVHAIFHVRNADEIDVLHNSFHAQMRAGLPLLPGSETLLRDHPLGFEVFKIYKDLTEGGVAFSSLTGDDWTRAKGMVLYQDRRDKSVTFQFVNDAKEDQEAHEWILELQRTVPKNNVGLPKMARLMKWRDDCFVEMCGLDEDAQ